MGAADGSIMMRLMSRVPEMGQELAGDSFRSVKCFHENQIKHSPVETFKQEDILALYLENRRSLILNFIRRPNV